MYFVDFLVKFAPKKMFPEDLGLFSRWFKVTFWFCRWRSRNHSKRHSTHPKKGRQQNCHNIRIYNHMFDRRPRMLVADKQFIGIPYYKIRCISVSPASLGILATLSKALYGSLLGDVKRFKRVFWRDPNFHIKIYMVHDNLVPYNGMFVYTPILSLFFKCNDVFT